MQLSACAKIDRKKRRVTVKAKSCKPKNNTQVTGVSQVVELLNTINNQLIGINNSINNDFNNLNSVITNGNSNLNSNWSNSVSALNSGLSNSITESANTIIGNMNTVTTPNCTVKEISNHQNFSVPCGSSETIIENLSSADIVKAFISAASNQYWNHPCQPVLVVVDINGNTIERALPPRVPPNFMPEEIHIVIDNYKSISIRCQIPEPSGEIPPPPQGVCYGFIQITEFVCICCEPPLDN